MDLRLHHAVSGRRIDELRSLVQQGLDPNGRSNSGGTPLHWAAKCSVPAAIDILMAASADVDARDEDYRTPLILACFEMTQWDEDDEKDRMDPKNEQLELIKALLSNGASVNAVDSSGRSALHMAAMRSNPLVCQALIERGADLGLVDNKGRTVRDACSLSKNKLCLAVIDAHAPKIKTTLVRPKGQDDDDSEVDSEDEELPHDATKTALEQFFPRP